MAAPRGQNLPTPWPSRTCSMSIGTRPTMLTTLLSRRPVCFDWKEESRIVERRPATRPRKGNPSTGGYTAGRQLQRGAGGPDLGHPGLCQGNGAQTTLETPYNAAPFQLGGGLGGVDWGGQPDQQSGAW